MPNGNGLPELIQALKEDEKAKNPPPVAEIKGEVKEEVAEIKEEVKEEVVLEEKEEEVVEVPPNLSERAQARIDGLVERVIDKDKKIIELEKKLESLAGKPKSDVDPVLTKDQILAFLAGDEVTNSQRAWLTDKLTDIKMDEKLGKRDISEQLKSELVSSYERAKEEYPDMADTKSEMYQRANEIYLRKNLKNDPDGQYIAATLAYRSLEKENSLNKPSNEVLQKRLDKEAGKKGLATVSKKTVINSEDALAKLEKEAITAGANSPLWYKYLAEMEKDRLAKKKK